MHARTLLLIHGYPFDHTLWDRTRAHLPSSIQVLAPDLRGFGGTPTGEGTPSLERMADDLAEFLTQNDAQRAVVAGMSMGGYVALALAERHPSTISGLCLVSSQSAADTDDARKARRTMIDKIREEGPNVAANAVIPKLFSPANTGKPELVRFPMIGAARAGVAGLTWALEAMAQRPDRTNLLKSLPCPILFIHGAEDQIVPAVRVRELANSISNSEYVELPSAGHATPLESPAAAAVALSRFLDRCYPR